MINTSRHVQFVGCNPMQCYGAWPSLQWLSNPVGAAFEMTAHGIATVEERILDYWNNPSAAPGSSLAASAAGLLNAPGQIVSGAVNNAVNAVGSTIHDSTSNITRGIGNAITAVAVIGAVYFLLIHSKK